MPDGHVLLVILKLQQNICVVSTELVSAKRTLIEMICQAIEILSSQNLNANSLRGVRLKH